MHFRKAISERSLHPVEYICCVVIINIRQSVSQSVLSAVRRRLASLLQVTVHLEAVVARVSDSHVAVRGESKALGPVKGVR